MVGLDEADAGVAGYYDPEKTTTGDHYAFTETTPTYIRHDFVKKVFGILALQLAVTFGFMLTVYNVEAARLFFHQRPWLAYIGFFPFLILSMVVAFSTRVRQNKKATLVITSIMTLCMMIYMTTFCVRHRSTDILIATGTTLAIVVGIALFAVQTKYDFTGLLANFYTFILGTLIFLVLAAILRNTILKVFISVGVSVLISLYIMIDIQLIVGGKRFEWTVDDYMIASITIYSDIVHLFLNILDIVGRR